MDANLSTLKTTITRAEETLYVMHQALETRVPKQLVQLDLDSPPIKRFQTYTNRDIDGRPYVMLQAVIHIDDTALDTANHPWERLIDVTSMSIPSVYTV